MRSAIENFWKNLLIRLNNTINQWLNKKHSTTEIIDAGDDTVVNFFAMILKKVINRSLMGAEYNIITDSTQAEPLKVLCEDLQDNIYKVAGNMLGGKTRSECWVVPSFITVGGTQKLIHSYLSGDRICITNTKEDGQISECYMILNATKRKDKVYLLCRKHVLDDNGNLTISYFVTNEEAKEISANVVPEWDNIVATEITYPNANTIGFGRYKSPVVAFNNDTEYGVPLNYNCGIIEKQLNEAVELIAYEMRASKKMLFPDWSIVRKTDKDGNPIGMWKINEYIFPTRKVPGVNGSLIDEYCPAIRGSEYEEHLSNLLERYQSIMGVTELITHKSRTKGATATEIKTINTDNISLEHSIKKSIRKGNVETLEADAMYLGIARDLWEYDEDYTDIYQDEQQTLNNLIQLYNTGAIELRDIVKYWFPTYSDEEIDNKVMAIEEEKKKGTQKSIEELLNV